MILNPSYSQIIIHIFIFWWFSVTIKLLLVCGWHIFVSNKCIFNVIKGCRWLHIQGCWLKWCDWTNKEIVWTLLQIIIGWWRRLRKCVLIVLKRSVVIKWCVSLQYWFLGVIFSNIFFFIFLIFIDFGCHFCHWINGFIICVGLFVIRI